MSDEMFHNAARAELLRQQLHMWIEKTSCLSHNQNKARKLLADYSQSLQRCETQTVAEKKFFRTRSSYSGHADVTNNNCVY